MEVEDCEDVNDMVQLFTEKTTRALDKVAPEKTFSISSNHRFGLSESTKELMRKRDRTRQSIHAASGKEKQVLLLQYRLLRNRVTSKIRKENIEYNNKRIEEACNEKEIWNVANEVINPRRENEWNILNKDGENITDKAGVAECFNEFFITKVQELKDNIDPTLVEDPLARLANKLKGIGTSLEFKTISQTQTKNFLKKLNKKKSSGLDGLSQENLLLGTKNLLAPLTTIINQSITQGEFPEAWKQAAVTPVLKKGNPQLLSNYRPVSCLPAASKVLEIVIYNQLSDYLESNKLLPNNQHGFRPQRSTMTAWQEIQLDWALNTEQKMVTGVLLWDLSAAFDTLDCEGLCKKLALFGVGPRSVDWVRSFLTGRSQKVRIGNEVSSARRVVTGVPQGGVLSPLIFVLFVSDLQDWLHHSSAPTYADDTSTGTHGKTAQETMEKMEVDAKHVLQYMASNGLVANAKKTSFLLLNSKQTGKDVSLKIGSDTVIRDSSAKLLGMTFEDNQQWKMQVYGKGGLISALNSRLYIIRRLKNHLDRKSLLKVVDGLFMSKIRYGVQLLGRVRLCIEDPESGMFKDIQRIQNNLLRTLNGSQIAEKVSILSMLNKFKMLSVNQLNASVKLLVAWKSLNIDNYPLKVKRQKDNDTGVNTRGNNVERPIEIGKTPIVQKTSISDSIRLWNKSPKSVTESDTLYQVKKEIKKFVISLPI